MMYLHNMMLFEIIYDIIYGNCLLFTYRLRHYDSNSSHFTALLLETSQI